MVGHDTPEYQEAKYRIKLSHFTEQGYDLKGIVHAGANDGEEVRWYQQMGIEHILCFDPLPSAAEIFRKTYPDVPFYELALGDWNGSQTLKITYGDGKGSTLFEPNRDHPEVRANWDQHQADIVGEVNVQVMKFRSFLIAHPEIDIANYDTLVLDTQGNELDVLKGMKYVMDGFKYLSIELSETPVYAGEAPAQYVIDYLTTPIHGRPDAVRWVQDSPIQSHNDVMFVRTDIKATSDQAYRGLA